MGFVLDSIVKHEFIEATETVNTTFITEPTRIDGVEESFSVSLTYDNGISVNMDLYLEVSVDGVNFAPIYVPQTVVDDTGTHIWDIGGSGTTYCRVRIEPNSGSIDVQSITLSGKRRH